MLINTGKMVEEKCEQRNVTEQFFKMKVDFIKDKYSGLAEELAKRENSLKDMQRDLSDVREQEAYEKKELNHVLLEIEKKEKHLKELEDVTEQKTEDIKSKESMNERLKKEIESIKKKIEVENRTEQERKQTLTSIRKDEREIYHKLQSVKGNVRVCVRIRPDQEAPQGDHRSMVEGAHQAEETVLEYNESENQIKLSMPKAVRFI